MKQAEIYVGIDVAKDRVDVSIARAGTRGVLIKTSGA